jgi:hyperosmotically inducible protein
MKIERVSHALTLAALLGLAAAGCATSGTSETAAARRQVAAAGESSPRGPVQTASDATINGKVKAALAADDLVKARNINVDTIRGVVQLNGTVHSAAEKNQAIALARKVDGVVEVRDNLKVAG